uniref:Peptidase M20 dimerisation domain-containing protein n=1 Tax=Arcella intermedia TaxID=1963864 RepID=A0A6B2L3A1_9EUKA
MIHQWAKDQNVAGMTSEIKKLPDKTPLIFFEIKATEPSNTNTVLMYGHMDKQPPLTETWAPGLHPYKPVIRDGKLYGRGGADDGYSLFSAIVSIKALQLQGIPHARIVILIEGSEESGSPDLVDYITFYEKQIGSPTLIVCLDSGAGNYDQFWTTTSLRGLISGDLTVKILNEGCHSGTASGVIPSSFRILRLLLDRIEDSQTGEIKVPELFTEVPVFRKEEIKKCSVSLGDTVYKEMALVEGAKPVTLDVAQLIENRTWKPTLSITGVDGIPHTSVAGNVLRTHTTVKLSIRVPPRVDADAAVAALQKVLTANPPYGAHVQFTADKAKAGFEAPELSPWLDGALKKASQFYMGNPPNFLGEGGSIPFMGMLREKYPQAQFVITGVLGPQSNAHGPNEFLHIPFAKQVTGCVASILADHQAHFAKL